MQWNVLYNKDIVELSLKEFGILLHFLNIQKCYTWSN